MPNLLCVVLFYCTIGLLTFERVNAYRKYYVEDECISPSKFQKITFRLPATGPDSVGVLRPNRFGTYSRMGRNCLIRLVPPDDHGLVINVFRVDFRNEGCRDYIEIYDEDDNHGDKLCGHQQIGKEGKTFFTDGEAKILYHTSEGGMGFGNGFSLVFTVTKLEKETAVCSSPTQFKCDNSRCIWAGAACDGTNNCGDSSDENSYKNAHCSHMTPVAITAVVLGIITFIAIIAVMCLCCCRSQDTKPQKYTAGLYLRPNAGYCPLPGYTPLPGYSYGAVDGLKTVPGFHPVTSAHGNSNDFYYPGTASYFARPTTSASPTAPPCPMNRGIPHMAQKIEITYDKPPPYKP